ncbi:MAG: helix-turn-helix transcriptional regulator [bacterium]|nr:helix-turn-helix transcriptional regulator [bacterium]
MKRKRPASHKKYLRAIGTNIRSLRHKKGLSQEAFAAKANLDRTYIGSVERGERNISALNLKKVAEALGVSASVLLYVPGE